MPLTRSILPALLASLCFGALSASASSSPPDHSFLRGLQTEECQGCLHNGICHDVGDEYMDACNTCTCSGPNNLAACTAMACEPCTACEDQYCVDEQYLAADGCNTCTCGSEDGLAKCTKKACPETTTDPTPMSTTTDCQGCLHNGICHSVGDQYLDACNTCTCGAEDGTAACTAMACQPCTACSGGATNGTYCVDEQFLAADGCNTCTCSGPNNLAACTMMACDVPMPAACQMDVKDCGNDVFVDRDPNNNCQFPACPTDATTMSTTDCEGCKHNGVCIPVGDGYLDGCNQCTCSGTGVSLCTEMACPNCTACEGQYCVGELFLAEDGCNTCTCGSEDGMATCTMMACPEPPPTTCENNGITYDVGQSFVDECNTCECTEQGAICTLMACECTACKGANNETYCVGEVFADDCNTCTCGSEDGLVMCTVMACPGETAVETVSTTDAGPTCENNGITYSVGQFYKAGCNSCECTDTGSVCTRMACDCDACEGEYCVGEVFLADDGCNTCSCGSEDGIVMCTQMACPVEPAVACAMDVKDCGNDVFVDRDPNNNCEFPDCPVACAMDVKDCGNDVFVNRDPNNNCEFPACPVTTQQTGEDVPSSATMIVIGSGSVLLFLNSLAIVAINLF